MTVETVLLISGISVAFALYQGINNMRRNNKTDDRNDASQLTTVIVKLENISNGISEIKREMTTIKEDIKNLFNNKAWIILAIVGIVSFVMFAMQNAAIAYYFKYYLGRENNVQLFNVIGTIALIVALPLSKPLAKRFGNKRK